jgi:uncharacterized alkaline shock family protein YloU
MEESLGTVTIHPSVLVTVARLTALATPGVVRLGDRWRLDVGRVLSSESHSHFNGVDVFVSDDNIVMVDVEVIAEPETNLVQLGETLQVEVVRAINEIVGMEVATVNVFVLDVECGVVQPV